MNRIIIAVLIAIAFYSCTFQDKETVISGKIHGYSSSPIYLYPAEVIYMNKPFGEPIISSTTTKDGEFRFKIQLDDSQFINLFVKDSVSLLDAPVLANVNDSINIETSIYNTSRPIFGGENASLNHFNLELRQSLSKSFRNHHVYGLTIDHYNRFSDSIQDKWINLIDSIAMVDSSNRKAVELVKADLLLFIAVKKYEYLQQHLNETEGIWKYLIPESIFYSFNNDLPKKTEEFWFLPSYSMAVDAMLEDDYQHLQQVIDDPAGMYPQMLELKLQIVEERYEGVAKAVALTQLARKFPLFLSSSDPFVQFQKADSLMGLSSSKSALNNYFRCQIDRVLPLKPGERTPNILLPNETGQLVSLDDFKGKNVLLIFWGTWCPPCLASMPKYISIQEHFKNEMIEFVFISLEARTDDVEQWKSFVSGQSELSKRFLDGKTFPGIHLVAHGQFKNPQVVPYAVTSAPSYVLIDHKGKIVRPRVNLDDELIAKIEELLKNE